MGSWTGSHKLSFREIAELTIVEIRYELVCQKIAERRISAKKRKGLLHVLASGDLAWEFVLHHALKKSQVGSMLPRFSARTTRRHDVSR